MITVELKMLLQIIEADGRKFKVTVLLQLLLHLNKTGNQYIDLLLHCAGGMMNRYFGREIITKSVQELLTVKSKLSSP